MSFSANTTGPPTTPAAIGDEAPLVLNKGSGLPDVTADVLADLQPASVIVLGGKDRIPDSILTDIETVSDAGDHRVSGSNRFDTAAQLSLRWAPGEADTVYLASGTMVADASAVGPLADIEDSPVLLTKDATLPPETADALTRSDPDRIVVLGGPDRVDEDVVTQVGPYADTVERLLVPTDTRLPLWWSLRYLLATRHTWPRGSPSRMRSRGLCRRTGRGFVAAERGSRAERVCRRGD